MFLRRSFFIFLAVLFCFTGYAEADSKLEVFTSILPQKFFVEKIGGDLVNVEVFVGPGMSPHTYEPLPQQMSRLSRARLFFTIGVPFEKSLKQRIVSVCPGLKLVETDAGIKRRSMQSGEDSFDHEHHEGCTHGSGEPDPHIWLDPDLVMIQAQNIAAALKAEIPEKAGIIESRLSAFIAELSALSNELAEILEPYKGQTMLVFHPAFGYLADRYGLVQRAIEIEGKEPGPRQLVELIRRCRSENIHVVFVQKQFPVSAAETVARSINGRVVAINPLAENYIENLKEMALAIAGGVKRK